MSNVKISQLPEYTGNTSGSWLIMNNSGETTTYKVKKENMVPAGGGLFAQTGSYWNTTNNIGITGSLDVKGSSNLSGSLNVTGALRVNGGYVNPNINVINAVSGNYITAANGSSPSSYNLIEARFGYNQISASVNYFEGATNIMRDNLILTGSLDVSGSVKIGRTNSVGSTVDLFIQSGSNKAYQNFGTFNNLTYHTLFASGSDGQSILALDNGSGTFSLIKTESQLNIEGANASHKVSIKNNTEVTGALRVTDIPTGSTSNQYVVYNTGSKQLERTTTVPSTLKTKSYNITGTTGWTYPGSGSVYYYNLTFGTPFSSTNYAGSTMYRYNSTTYFQHQNASYQNATTTGVTLRLQDVPQATTIFTAIFIENGES